MFSCEKLKEACVLEDNRKMEHSLDLRRVKIVSDYDEMSEVAAEIISKQIKCNPLSVIGFATGGTPLGLYRRLVRMYENGELDFSRVTTFNLDEYVGLGNDNPQSYCYYMYTNLFSKVNINKNRVHIPDGLTSDYERACRDYDSLLLRAGGIDIQILGIGGNGHIGFNEPGTPFESCTQVVKLAEETVEANARFFPNKEDVPRYAISMGIKSIMRARRIILLASGSGKHQAINRSLYGPVTTDVPASVLQLHPDVTYIVDEEAASSL